VAKLADLMCLFEHIFVLLTVIDLMIQVIKGKWSKGFKTCNGGAESGNILSDDDLCASFLQAPVNLVDEDNEIWNSRVKGINGEMWYCNEVYGLPFPLFPATSVAQLRPEEVYLRDDTLVGALQFNNLIAFKPLNEMKYFPFFPFESTITPALQKEKIPYFEDIIINADPDDGNGSRNILVQDVVVTLPTYTATLGVTGNQPVITTDPKGFVKISGGTTVDDSFGYNGHTIEELLRADSGISASTNGEGTQKTYSGVNHQLKVNYISLVEYQLITLGCLPSMQVEIDYFDTVNEKGLSTNLPDLVDLPDVATALASMNKCLSDYRENITEETTEEFGVCMNDILADLSNQANGAYCQLLLASVDIFNTTKALEPDIQFTTQPIEVTVTPKSNDNRTIADLVGGFGSSVDIDGCMSDKFSAEVTLGEISGFTYDGYGNFVAEITSNIAGDGYALIFYDGEQIPLPVAPTNVNEEPYIDYSPLNYTFIGLFDGVGGIAPAPRREERDTSGV